MHRRVNVAEVPLVCRNLSTGMKIMLREHEVELLLGEIQIDRGEGYCMEGEVPCSIPRIFPLVGHGYDVSIHHVEPVLIPGIAAAVVERMGGPIFKTLIGIEIVILLGPEHTGQ